MNDTNATASGLQDAADVAVSSESENAGKPEGSTVDLAGRRVRLTIELEELELQMAARSKEIRAIDSVLLDRFANEGVQNMNVMGRTLYLNRLLSINKGKTPGGDPLSTEEIIEKFREVGGDWEEFIGETYNTNSVAAFVRRLPKDEDEMPILPPGINEVLVPVAVLSIRCKK